MGFFFLLTLLISAGGLGWIVLALAGINKGPVLAKFERYGPEPPYYFPLPSMIFWLAGIVFSTGLLLRDSGMGGSAIEIAGVVLFLLAVFAWNQKPYWQRYAETLPTLPAWYAHLREYTSRYERRRIAYMWLRLPLRTRLLYNANHQAFFTWADLVIMATVRDS